MYDPLHMNNHWLQALNLSSLVQNSYQIHITSVCNMQKIEFTKLMYWPHAESHTDSTKLLSLITKSEQQLCIV